MDPMFSSEWSVSEIKMAKSLIASRNTSSNLASDDDASNKKHSDIVDELQARFPWKGKHEVIGLYVDLTMEMINTPPEVGDDGLVLDDDNFGMPVEEQPQMKYTGRFWTREEHRNFLRGLNMYGRGNWMYISRDFVPTKTPMQIYSHAQKFFRR
ncbi:transcription factor KUA1 [Zea mays]|eukprot:XP_008670548.1 transcription factor KUA1 [Zea mays]